MEAKVNGESRDPSQHETVVLDKVIAIEPAAWYAYQVSIDLSEVPGCHIDGTFTASGGTGNDIEVLILPQRGYKEWEHRMRAGSSGEPREVAGLYRSGRVASAAFDIPVPRSDTYYLVFSNYFSSFINKDVRAKAYLHWGK